MATTPTIRTLSSAALPVSVFTLGPDRTTAILSHLPYLVDANAAAQNTNAALSFGCGGSGNCF